MYCLPVFFHRCAHYRRYGQRLNPLASLGYRWGTADIEGEQIVREIKAFIGQVAGAFTIAGVIAGVMPALADSTEARCDFYPKGSDQVSKSLKCQFSQRQGWITLSTDDATYELEPVGDDPGTFKDNAGLPVYRQSGLGDQGQIFRFEDKAIYVYWDTAPLDPSVAGENSPTAPFSIADFDATTVLRCLAAGASKFGSCPAGILRMDDGQATVVVQNQKGDQFTINFMSDYVNATNREVAATLKGNTWTVTDVATGEVYEVPLAAIEGG